MGLGRVMEGMGLRRVWEGWGRAGRCGRPSRRGSVRPACRAVINSRQVWTPIAAHLGEREHDVTLDAVLEEGLDPFTAYRVRVRLRMSVSEEGLDPFTALGLGSGLG